MLIDSEGREVEGQNVPNRQGCFILALPWVFVGGVFLIFFLHPWS